MATRMQQRRGTALQWTTANPVLEPGEIGWESDTNKFKIGDGTNTWSTLDYFLSEADLEGSIDDFVPLTSVGEPDGVASLDATGNVPLTQLGNVPEPDFTGYATETYVDSAINDLIDTAPETLNTLNELASALNDDANFATTIANSIAGKADTAHTHTMSDITDLEFPPSTVLSDTEPQSPTAGTRWIKTTTMQEYVYYGNSWIEI